MWVFSYNTKSQDVNMNMWAHYRMFHVYSCADFGIFFNFSFVYLELYFVFIYCSVLNLSLLHVSAQVCRVSRPRLTGVPSEWHLHRSVKLLCPPLGHGWETRVLAASLQARVSKQYQDMKCFRMMGLLLQSFFCNIQVHFAELCYCHLDYVIIVKAFCF